MQDLLGFSHALTPGEAQVRRALTIYLCVFCAVSIAGWLPEIAGRMGAAWISADYSALFHHSNTFDSASDFHDLTDFAARMQHLSGPVLAGAGAPFPYPPAGAFVFEFFLKGVARPVAAYMVAFGLALAGFTASLLWSLRRHAVANRGLAVAAAGLTLLAGFPQIFTLFRANLEWVNCGLTALALIAFLRKRYLAMAILLGLAVAMKPFPVVFFVLLLWRRRYAAIAAGLGVTAAASVAALFALGPTFAQAVDSIGRCWADYFQHYVLTVRLEQEIRFNHSLLDAVKLFLWFVYDHQRYDARILTAGLQGLPLWARLDLWTHVFAAVAVVAMAWIGWNFRRMPALNGIFALSIAELLLPYVAAEYTLMLMLVPWALLLVTVTREPDAVSSRQLLRLLIPCALLFSPLSVLSCFSGLAKTLCLLWMLREVWRTPWHASWLNEKCQPRRLASS